MLAANRPLPDRVTDITAHVDAYRTAALNYRRCHRYERHYVIELDSRYSCSGNYRSTDC
jgi:hypothetical protein